MRRVALMIDATRGDCTEALRAAVGLTTGRLSLGVYIIGEPRLSDMGREYMEALRAMGAEVRLLGVGPHEAWEELAGYEAAIRY